MTGSCRIAVMGLGTRSWLSLPSLLRTLVLQVRLAIRLLREPGVPLIVKALPLVAILYVVLPLDFVPDVLPIVGQLDDLGVIVIALEAFVRLCPSRAVEFHRGAMTGRRKYSPMPSTGDVIDVEFHHEQKGR
jgi:uncharacterized membrane protein YkvA (DUF1232 family)